jgi:hypothetical protein
MSAGSPAGSGRTSGRPAAGAEGGTRRWQAAAWPAASSAAAHRRGPLPPRGQPRMRPWAVPAITLPGGRACESRPGGPPAPGSLTPRKDHNQGRTSSLRCGRSTLIVIFHGKNRHLSGGRGECGRAGSWRTEALAAPSRAARNQGKVIRSTCPLTRSDDHAGRMRMHGAHGSLASGDASRRRKSSHLPAETVDAAAVRSAFASGSIVHAESCPPGASALGVPGGRAFRSTGRLRRGRRRRCRWRAGPAKPGGCRSAWWSTGQ